MNFTVRGAIGGVVVIIILALIIGAFTSEREKARDLEDRSPAISYGSPYLKHTLSEPRPTEPIFVSSTGEMIWICFDDVVWLRLIPLTSKVWFLTDKGKRIDYDDAMTVHYIKPAAQTGPLSPKCRAWAIPAGLPMGETVLTGLTVPSDPASKAAAIDFPRIKFVVK